MSETKDFFSEFIEVVRALRHPQTGCPWDLEQTHESLRPYLVEECYETLEAIEAKDDKELLTELGDVLLQVVLHSQVASERGAFTIDDVIKTVSEKMIRRHPHVFGETKGEVKSASEVIHRWEAIKHAERKDGNGKKTTPPSRLDGVPTSLPALIRAQRLGEKASKANFDWRNVSDVWAKIKEELAELEAEIRPMVQQNDMGKPAVSAPTKLDKHSVTHELGDVFFALAQLARKLDLGAEDSLRECCSRFTSRFNELERALGDRLFTTSDEDLEAEWQRAKKRLAGS